MQLFTADLFKAFAAGFVLTAAAMSNTLVPGLWSETLPQALAAIL